MAHVVEFYSAAGVEQLIPFWTHALAAMLFVALTLWQLRGGARQSGQRLLLACTIATALWAWLQAINTGGALPSLAETARNLGWVSLLYLLSNTKEDQRRPESGVQLVYAAVAAVLGFQLVLDMMTLLTPAGDAQATIKETGLILRITAAAGALVLVHNFYGQAAPSSRSGIRLSTLALALIWTYDLNLYTLAYLTPEFASGASDWRGAVVSLSVPLFALGSQQQGWRFRPSRAATFQSLSLLAICAYFAAMTILTTVLRGAGWNIVHALALIGLAAMTAAALILVPSPRARSWVTFKLSKHLFEHRYDYRAEWQRFTEVVGRTGPETPPLSQRVIKALADLVDSPGGLLLALNDSGHLETAAAWKWEGSLPKPEPGDSRFWNEAQESGTIVELDACRHRLTPAREKARQIPNWIMEDQSIWAGVPLIHLDRLVGFVLLAAPDYRRPLDWEDFDLLRTAGRQAASSLAEAHNQAALMQAQRFEEFNRRFAFILHDIKNLVSQLSLLSRNAERHAGNADFQADMIGTLKSSVGKMNELLARLTHETPQPSDRAAPIPLRPILADVIAAKRRNHDIRLLGDASHWAIADPASLEQAFAHLLQNAIDASPVDKPVLVRTSSADGEVLIEIVDSGCGMDPEFVRNSLFQPFTSTKPDGFGVGAFEARSLVAAMRGRLTVDSRIGKGTHLTIHLPAAEPEDLTQRKRA